MTALIFFQESLLSSDRYLSDKSRIERVLSIMAFRLEGIIHELSQEQKDEIQTLITDILDRHGKGNNNPSILSPVETSDSGDYSFDQSTTDGLKILLNRLRS